MSAHLPNSKNDGRLFFKFRTKISVVGGSSNLQKVFVRTNPEFLTLLTSDTNLQSPHPQKIAQKNLTIKIWLIQLQHNYNFFKQFWFLMTNPVFYSCRFDLIWCDIFMILINWNKSDMELNNINNELKKLIFVYASKSVR